MSPEQLTDATGVCMRSVGLMATGTPAEFAAVIHPDAHNREDSSEPAASRGRGPAAFHASALWLRSAFADLHWEIRGAVADGDVVVLDTVMSGRQTGPFVAYDAAALPSEVFPPTGRTFAVRQTHWQRVAGGMVLEHWASRDDLGMAKQLGWVPPTLPYIVRMATATRRARRAATRATAR